MGAARLGTKTPGATTRFKAPTAKGPFTPRTITRCWISPVNGTRTRRRASSTLHPHERSGPDEDRHRVAAVAIPGHGRSCLPLGFDERSRLGVQPPAGAIPRKPWPTPRLRREATRGCPARTRSGFQRLNVLLHELARAEHRRIRRPADRRLFSSVRGRTTRAEAKAAVFEASRPHWLQMPSAVQVSAAKNISFVRDRFVDLGEVGLGIGNDASAHATGLGLGTNGINVTGCVFSQIAGGGIVVGGIQAWAHHPCGDKVCASTDPGSKISSTRTSPSRTTSSTTSESTTETLPESCSPIRRAPSSRITRFTTCPTRVSPPDWDGAQTMRGATTITRRGLTGTSTSTNRSTRTRPHRQEQHGQRQLCPPRHAPDERRRVSLQPGVSAGHDGYAKLL